MRGSRMALAATVLGVSLVGWNSVPRVVADQAAEDAKAAEEQDAKSVELLKEAKITLANAVQAAETKSKGKAFFSQIEEEGGKLMFEVKVSKGKKILEVEIDAKSGEIIAVEDTADEKNEAKEKAGEKGAGKEKGEGKEKPDEKGNR